MPILPALAQGNVHFGVKAGVPATRYFETGLVSTRATTNQYTAATRRYTVGVSVEWRPTNRLAAEFDVLYKRTGYDAAGSAFSGVSQAIYSFSVKGHSWDLPLMAKYRFGRTISPYLAAGMVLRYIGPVRLRGTGTAVNLITRESRPIVLDTDEPSDLRKRHYPGITFAGGVEFAVGRLRLLPEFRYSHWTSNINSKGSPGAGLRFHPDQAEFLLGFLF